MIDDDYSPQELPFHDVERWLEQCEVSPVAASNGFRERVLTAGAEAYGYSRAVERMQWAGASVAALFAFLMLGNFYATQLPKPAPPTGASARSVFAEQVDALSSSEQRLSDSPEWTLVEASLASRQFSSALLAGVYSERQQWPGGG